jgi:long-subunit fatty acid transport protein
MKFNTIFLLTLFISCQVAIAQTIDDAVRYSFLDPGGTARTAGVGGAIGALGADFSVLSTNPAGLAAFRRSEFTFTPTLDRSTVDALLNGENNFMREQQKNNFNFNNLGLVFASRPVSSGWTVSAFGIGLNRMANFHQDAYFEGVSEGSITDRWLEESQGLTTDELDGFETGVAYEGEAIYQPDPNDNTLYASDFPENTPVSKSQLIKRKGAISELVFSLAGNYQDRLLIGATMGVPFLNYEETKIYEEKDETGDIDFFEDLTYTERLQTTGAGINLKLGLIYRLNQMVRLGLAFHTPTGLGLTDNFSTEVNYNYTLDGTAYSGNAASPDGSFEYRLRTPWRFIGSGGLVFGKSGFISAEVEWLDYTNARFNFNQTTSSEDIAYEQELNDLINNELESALNIRLGGEFAYELFRLRGGVSFLGAPFAEGIDPTDTVSLGAGIRGENVFLDLAYRRLVAKSDYAPYLTTAAPQPVVNFDDVRDRFMLTLGFKF